MSSSTIISQVYNRSWCGNENIDIHGEMKKEECIVCCKNEIFENAAADYQAPDYDFPLRHKEKIREFLCEQQWAAYYIKIYVKMFGNVDTRYNSKLAHIIVDHAENMGAISSYEFCPKRMYLEFMFDVYNEIAKPHYRKLSDYFEYLNYMNM